MQRPGNPILDKFVIDHTFVFVNRTDTTSQALSMIADKDMAAMTSSMTAITLSTTMTTAIKNQLHDGWNRTPPHQQNPKQQ
jgi:hypothetical protein